MPAGTDDKPTLDGPTRPTTVPHPRQIEDGPGLEAANAAANDRFRRNSEALQARQAERREAEPQSEASAVPKENARDIRAIAQAAYEREQAAKEKVREQDKER